jgi:nicotinamidase-related amidase
MSDRQSPSHIWRDLLSSEDLARIDAGKFARRSGVGNAPAIVVIDVQNYMIGPVGVEGYEYPSSCGTVGLRATERISALLLAGRRHRLPIFYTRFEVARDGSDIGVYGRKREMVNSEGWCLAGSFGSQIADRVAPEPGEIILVKKKPSGFFGTPLLPLLIDRGVDTVIVVGGSTSVCVRATAVDAASFNFRVVVPADCVFDRFEISHRTTLFDLDRQHADVLWSSDLVDLLAKRAAA